jgi:GNAT superfamily N-acetyltransferase
MLSILKAGVEDAEEILALQKLAYQSEAARHNDFSTPPLHQTLSEIRAQFSEFIFLKAPIEDSIIGSVRARLADDTCCIGRLIVHPNFQNQGTGKKLMIKIGTVQAAHRFELLTGYLSEKNLYLSQKLGYREFRREEVNQ